MLGSTETTHLGDGIAAKFAALSVIAASSNTCSSVAFMVTLTSSNRSIASSPIFRAYAAARRIFRTACNVSSRIDAVAFCRARSLTITNCRGGTFGRTPLLLFLTRRRKILAEPPGKLDGHESPKIDNADVTRSAEKVRKVFKVEDAMLSERIPAPDENDFLRRQALGVLSRAAARVMFRVISLVTAFMLLEVRRSTK